MLTRDLFSVANTVLWMCGWACTLAVTVWLHA